MNPFTISSRDVDFVCEIHGAQSAKQVRFSGGDWGKPACRKCVDDKVTRIREIDVAKNTQAFYLRVGIPPRYLNATLDNYHTSSKKQKEELGKCQKFVENFVKNAGHSFMFCGKPGTGKTHLACAIATALRSHSSKYVNIQELVRSVNETYRHDSDDTESKIFHKYARVDLLILDEVGVQLNTETNFQIIFEILNKRYEHLKSTILISNLDLAALTELLGEKIMDRFREDNGSVLVFDWESFRKGRSK